MEVLKHSATRSWPMLVVLGVALGSGLWSSALATETESASRSSRSSRAGTKPSADQRSDLVRLDEKLDRLLAQQEQILQKFEGIMEELRIIKVRSTH